MLERLQLYAGVNAIENCTKKYNNVKKLSEVSLTDNYSEGLFELPEAKKVDSMDFLDTKTQLLFMI